MVCEFAAGDHDGKEIMGKCEVNHDMAVDMHGGQMGAKQKTDSSILTAPQDGSVVSYSVIILWFNIQNEFSHSFAAWCSYPVHM